MKNVRMPKGILLVFFQVIWGYVGVIYMAMVKDIRGRLMKYITNRSKYYKYKQVIWRDNNEYKQK